LIAVAPVAMGRTTTGVATSHTGANAMSLPSPLSRPW
jgi:hypothetical protein